MCWQVCVCVSSFTKQRQMPVQRFCNAQIITKTRMKCVLGIWRRSVVSVRLQLHCGEGMLSCAVVSACLSFASSCALHLLTLDSARWPSDRRRDSFTGSRPVSLAVWLGHNRQRISTSCWLNWLTARWGQITFEKNPSLPVLFLISYKM